MSDGVQSERSSEAAEQEAAVLGHFAHLNIVRLLDLKQPYYLLMPFLEGTLLSDHINGALRRRLAISDALRVAVHLGSALLHVHKRGYVHLDIKPDNVIISRGGLPILFDFGTARRIDARRPSQIIGTNAYIAPEECRLGNAGPGADVFSLGVTLFEMLTGNLPFGKGSPDAPFPQLRRTAKPLGDLLPRAPVALESLLGSCLEHDANSRPTLTKLLPSLNKMIHSGSRMWPDGFDPKRQEPSVETHRISRETERHCTRVHADFGD